MGTLTRDEKRRVRKPLLWIGIASITMTFAGLTSGYVVSRSALLPQNNWLQFNLPAQFYWATGVMLLSSLFMVWAKRQVKQGKSATGGLVLALLCGLTFVFLQLMGAQALVDKGLHFTGTNTAVSWVYVIAGLHWLHIVSGLIVLMVTIYQSQKGVYTSTGHEGLDLSAIYWHFLDLLWIYLFIFLAFIR